MFYLPRDRGDAVDRGWTRLTTEDFPWPLPGEAFWRILGTPGQWVDRKQGIYRRKLSFYAADPPAYLIAVEDERPADRRDDRVAYLVQQGTDLFPLTGRSDVVHDLNERLGGPRPNYFVDYVEFFCSFVSGDDGPFLVPRSDAERAEVVAQDDFAADAHRARAQLILPDENLEATEAAGGAALPGCRLVALIDAELAAARESATAAGWSGPEGSQLIGAHVIYGSAVFAATFAVAADGAIEMVNDDPLAMLQTVTRHRFVEHGGTSWLLREWGSRQKQRITAREFLDSVYAPGEPDAASGCPGAQHLEVEGDVVFPACKPLPWLHCVGVDFRGSVVMDDCHAGDRVLLQECRIFGSFSARRARFDKSLGLRRCQILALSGELGRPATREQDRWGGRSFGGPVGLCLDSARIEFDLDLERTLCNATLRARRLVVQGSVSLSGLRVLPAVTAFAAPAHEAVPATEYAATSSRVELDLSDGEFTGSVYLNCAFDHTAMAQMGPSARHCHRPIVVGVLRLDGIRIEGSLWIRGLGVLRLAKARHGEAHVPLWSMRQARIDGGLQNYDAASRVWPPPTRILGEADLTCSQFGNYADLSTFFITGDLELGAVTAQAIFLNAMWESTTESDADYGGAEPWLDYTAGHPDATLSHWRTTYVGGKLNLNNARISGSVYAAGLQARGSVYALDGASLGSLKIRSLPWIEMVKDPANSDGSETAVLRRHRPRLGAIELMTAKVAGTIQIFDADVGRGVLMNSCEIVGSIACYGREELLAQFLGDLDSNYNWGLTREQLGNWISGGLYTDPPSTRVGYDPTQEPGSLAITGSRIGGSVDLRNLRAAADILLDDTHITGDLATAPPIPEGEVLRRLNVGTEGGQRMVTPTLSLPDCSAAVLQVHGNSIDFVADTAGADNLGELCIRTECRRFVFGALDCSGDARLWRLAARKSVEGPHARIGGTLSFHVAAQGLEEARIHRNGEGGREVMLERARFQQLTLVEPFPRNVSLRGIEVEHWDPSPGGNAPPPNGGLPVDWERKAELMLKLLDRMPNSDPSVYLGVERHFRSLGHDDQADRLYCALRERQACHEETAAGAELGLWAWLVALSVPLLLVLMNAGFIPGAGGLFTEHFEPTTTIGLFIGLLAPWFLAYAFPPRRSEDRGSSIGARLMGRLNLSAGLVRGAALVVSLAVVFVSETVRAVLTIAALTFWTHLLLLLPAAIAFQRLRSVVLGRLMMRLGTGYGTASHRLVLVWLFLLLVPMAVVLHEPRNVEPTLFARGALKVGAGARPDLERWRWHALEPPPIWVWMAVESTVPIITLGAEDKWESADSPPAILHSLLGEYLDPEEFKVALYMVAGIADKLDDEIKAKFGGRFFHEDT